MFTGAPPFRIRGVGWSAHSTRCGKAGPLRCDLVPQHVHVTVMGQVTLVLDPCLGGALSAVTRFGVASAVAPDEVTCLDGVRYLLRFSVSDNTGLPSGRDDPDDVGRKTPELRHIVFDGPNRSCGTAKVIIAVLDDGEHLERFASWAMSSTCGVSYVVERAAGAGAGASQSSVFAGLVGSASSGKSARFVTTAGALDSRLSDLPTSPDLCRAQTRSTVE